MKTSAKRNAQYLAQLLKFHGCQKVVISPGSRNAPLIIALTNDPDYQCYSVPDERVAGFTALGMTLEKGEPVAIICTSGSAAANYYPAVVEAYYQNRPLVVITADRPKELIDQGVGQTIRQEGIFRPHIVNEANLLREPKDGLAQSYNQRLINNALLKSRQGPVQINVPFDEPLYESSDHYAEEVKKVSAVRPASLKPELSEFSKIWNQSEKVMLLSGFMDPNPALAKSMDKLNEKSPFLILSETVSNLRAGWNIRAIDRLINTISEEEKEALRPDLLITMGGEVVSKMVKQFLREFPPRQHWHLSSSGELRDTFQFLDGAIKADEYSFFEELNKVAGAKSGQYRDYWLKQNQDKSTRQEKYAAQAGFSDWLAFHEIIEALPENSVLHTANSASIRYSQLFDHRGDTAHYTNRGTSGIDGCTSTALGHALASKKPVTLITGDVAFLYDSNAFWQAELPPNLRVIILNNGGGNIFRIIKGPEKNENFERYQETVHDLKLSAVADTYGLEFGSVENREQLKEALPGFFGKDGGKGPRLLEIKTPRTQNPEVLLDYFRFLRNG